MTTLRLPGVNGSPVVEYRRTPIGTIERRALLPDGREYRDGGSEWRPVTPEEIATAVSQSTPVGEWLLGRE